MTLNNDMKFTHPHKVKQFKSSTYAGVMAFQVPVADRLKAQTIVVPCVSWFLVSSYCCDLVESVCKWWKCSSCDQCVL